MISFCPQELPRGHLSFLRFASYYCRFVEGVANLAPPLHKLVAELGGTKAQRSAGPSISEKWTEECQCSFAALKSKSTTAPVLAGADFSLPFILEVDASFGGPGPVLSQEYGGKVKTAYASRGLRPTERNMQNYSLMKLKFREYFSGHKCLAIRMLMPSPGSILQVRKTWKPWFLASCFPNHCIIYCSWGRLKQLKLRLQSCLIAQ